jgi:hypothetical protein
MTGDTWLEMPAIETAGRSLRPKHMIETSALLVYRGDKVCVAVRDPETATALLRQPDVRNLAAAEVQKLERNLPGKPAERLDSLGSGPVLARNRHHGVLLGDVVSRITKALGVSECGGCGQRRRTLNRIVIWRSKDDERRTR